MNQDKAHKLAQLIKGTTNINEELAARRKLLDLGYVLDEQHRLWALDIDKGPDSNRLVAEL